MPICTNVLVLETGTLTADETADIQRISLGR